MKIETDEIQNFQSSFLAFELHWYNGLWSKSMIRSYERIISFKLFQATLLSPEIHLDFECEVLIRTWYHIPGHWSNS